MKPNLKANLKTVYLQNNELHFLEGWFGYVSDNTFYLHPLRPIPVELAHIKTSATGNHYLMSGSFQKETITKKMFPAEDSTRTEAYDVIETTANLQPEVDNNFYYQFLLNDRDDISFSSDFDVLVDELVENPYHSEQYNRVVFASLPKHVPLLLDPENVICVSPF